MAVSGSGILKQILLKRRLPNQAIGLWLGRLSISGDASGGSFQADFRFGAASEKELAFTLEAWSAKSVGNLGPCFAQLTSGMVGGEGLGFTLYRTFTSLNTQDGYVAGEEFKGPISFPEPGQNALCYVTGTNPGAGNSALCSVWGYLFDRRNLLAGYPAAIPASEVEAVPAPAPPPVSIPLGK